MPDENVSAATTDDKRAFTFTKERRDAIKTLIREALQFADWAAGEGIAPADGQPADAPDDFLVVYSDATGDTDWETLPERIPALLDTLDAAEAKTEAEPVAWVIPGDDTARPGGAIDAMAWQEGEFTRPLYAAPPAAEPVIPDYFGSLVERARNAAEKASRKFPQPNYVALKIAEEAGEVVRGCVHYAENRMEWSEVEGEIVQLLAMLIRLVTEGDQINGVTPPPVLAAARAFEVEGQS